MTEAATWLPRNGRDPLELANDHLRDYGMAPHIYPEEAPEGIEPFPENDTKFADYRLIDEDRVCATMRVIYTDTHYTVSIKYDEHEEDGYWADLEGHIPMESDELDDDRSGSAIDDLLEWGR